jgi:hypothetical protein
MPDTRHRQRRAYLINRIKINPTAEAQAKIESTMRRFRSPGTDGKVEQATVRVQVPAALVEMAEFLAKEQGMTRTKFLSILLYEHLYDMEEEFSKQMREATALAKLANLPLLNED